MKPEDSLLGKTVAASRHYAPELLFPIARSLGRDALGLPADSALPFKGIDVWHGYELSWLDGKGKPVVALARMAVPFNSPNILESKSFKLYLNSLNFTRFESAELAKGVIARDLSAAAGAQVQVDLFEPDLGAPLQPTRLEGVLLDTLPLSVDDYHYQPTLLRRLLQGVGQTVSEKLVSHLFRSNCPVTGQPDWASIRISYEGQALAHESVLAYLVSFRDHQEFHEQCVERIFTDIWHHCMPQRLCVEAFFTRRGGLDICPLRCSDGVVPAPLRLLRQ